MHENIVVVPVFAFYELGRTLKIKKQDFFAAKLPELFGVASYIVVKIRHWSRGFKVITKLKKSRENWCCD